MKLIPNLDNEELLNMSIGLKDELSSTLANYEQFKNGNRPNILHGA